VIATLKTVRVFNSTTFLDMHAERAHLVAVLFLVLRERVEFLGLEFFDEDPVEMSNDEVRVPTAKLPNLGNIAGNGLTAWSHSSSASSASATASAGVGAVSGGRQCALATEVKFSGRCRHEFPRGSIRQTVPCAVRTRFGHNFTRTAARGQMFINPIINAILLSKNRSDRCNQFSMGV